MTLTKISQIFSQSFLKKKCSLRSLSNFSHFQKKNSRWPLKKIGQIFFKIFWKKKFFAVCQISRTFNFFFFDNRKKSESIFFTEFLRKKCCLCSSSNFLHFQNKFSSITLTSLVKLTFHLCYQDKVTIWFYIYHHPKYELNPSSGFRGDR